MIKRMRRRAAAAAAAFVMLMTISAGAFTAWAANGRIAFSDPSATVGGQVSVNMKVTSSENLESVNVMLAYDANVLEFVSGTNAEGDAGAVRVRGDGGTPNTKTLAFTLKFNARTAGTSKITVTSQEVYDSNSQLVTVDQVGSSTVTVGALQTASKDATLQSLQVSPGTLTPQFSPDVDTYSVTVGTDVEKLIVTAKSTDDNATNVVSGYEDLQMGENRVTCKVTAQDGETTKEYVIVVTKAEGGASAEGTGLATGVKMKISKREITVLEPDESVKIPEGFKESIINIDDNNKVRGWVWGGETEHQYCIVYGMNEAGETNFYRYDMKDTERTIQRYFEDPAVQSMVSKADYDQLADTYDKLCDDYKMFQIFLVAAILIAVGLLVLVLVVVLRKKDNGTGGRGRAIPGERRGRRAPADGSGDLPDQEDDYDSEEPYQDEYEDDFYEEDVYEDEDGAEGEYQDGSGDDGYYDQGEDEYRQEYEPGQRNPVPSGSSRDSARELREHREAACTSVPARPVQARPEIKPPVKTPEPDRRKPEPVPEDDEDDFEIFDL
ncbi:MAG: cadherin-like beta sandwich domain-containing protein [Clostridium sp.]|nr:cadherin-like beta sandwich domain-containing protein [Clostridium sp.]